MTIQLLTVQEVADRTRLATATIYKLAAANEIPCVRIRRRLLFPADEIEDWIRSGGEVTPPTPSVRR